MAKRKNLDLNQRLTLALTGSLFLVAVGQLCVSCYQGQILDTQTKIQLAENRPYVFIRSATLNPNLENPDRRYIVFNVLNSGNTPARQLLSKTKIFLFPQELDDSVKLGAFPDENKPLDLGPNMPMDLTSKDTYISQRELNEAREKGRHYYIIQQMTYSDQFGKEYKNLTCYEIDINESVVSRVHAKTCNTFNCIDKACDKYSHNFVTPTTTGFPPSRE